MHSLIHSERARSQASGRDLPVHGDSVPGGQVSHGRGVGAADRQGAVMPGFDYGTVAAEQPGQPTGFG